MSNSLVTAAAERLIAALYEYYDSGDYVVPFQSKDIADCVVGHSAAAGVAALAAGVLPGAGAAIAAVAATGAVWVMYIRMTKMIGAEIGKNALKFIASAVVSNLAMNAASMVALSFIPGLGAVACGVIQFVTVYAAGLIFLNLMTRLFKVQRMDVENISDEEWKTSIKSAMKSVNLGVVFKEAVSLFVEMKRDGTLNTVGSSVDIEEDDDT